MSRRVMLVSTAAPDRPHGSMVRYGAMVRAALERHAAGFGTVEELNLSPPQAWLNRFPAGWREPIRYARIAANARRLLPAQGDGILHLLDGSHAYLLGAVRQLSGPLVVTVHDLIPALCLRGELAGERPGRGAAWIVHRTLADLARADAWVADSANTRSNLVRLVGMDSNRVRVVHPAVSVGAGRAAAGGNSGNASPYILHVAGNNNFYKNRPGVIEVFAVIRRSVPVKLKLVGPPPDAVLRQAIVRTGTAAAIEFLSDMPEAGLAAMYRGAAFLLFPSTYEGFGWPPLEAMAFGCPVVCSTAGSLAEVVGGAALTAAPDDVSGLAAHGMEILLNPATRQRLVAAGYDHARKFSLAALATGLVQAYQAAEEVFRQRSENGRRI